MESLIHTSQVDLFSRRNGAALLTCAVLICAVLLVGCRKGNDDPDANTSDAAPGVTVSMKLRSAGRMHEIGQSDEAMKLVQEVLIESPDNVKAKLLALEIHDTRGEFCEAAALAVQVAEADHSKATGLLLRAFDRQLRCGDYAAAEKHLMRALELAPGVPDIHRTLAQVLNAQGRRYEASEHVRELIRLRVVQPNELLSLVDLRGPFSLASFDEIVDGSKVSQFTLGQARMWFQATKTDPTRGAELLRQITEKYPDSTAAAAFYGRVLAESGQFELFQQWLARLPAGIEEQPEYWGAIGTWLSSQERYPEAIRAFAEALHRDPTDRESLREMIRSLEILGKESTAIELRDRLADLDKIFRIAKDADAEQARWISETMQRLVRPWESAGWLMYSAQLSGQLAQQVPELNKRHAAIVAWERGATEQQIRDARLQRLVGFKIDQWPEPDLETSMDPATNAMIADLDTGIRLDDIANNVCIETRLDSGFPLDGGEFFPYQANGAGLAAMDYDLDGRCDLYVVQSGGKVNDPLSSTANQLFRLLPGDRFVEVSDSSETGDRGYGQGVCAGDVNQDGFPDLLVANIGANVVFINQGDGTFRAASELIQQNEEDWTSCLGLADLSGDHLPEIVEVNYIDDPRAYVVTCTRNYMDCQPQRFRKSADRIHLGLADGTFQPWRAVSAIRDDPKLGFGLVIANFDRHHGNDFFVANDGDLNHFWISIADDSGEHRYALVESAGVRGCSVGRRGRSQACMGVAAGDFDRDGTLDLHVTNFRNEPVNLFMQTQSGFFSDEARKYALHEPSFGVLGFGTQAADFDNDGWSDLAVVNGHVFDARFEDIPFDMPPQLFRGSEKGFALQKPESAGEYWQKTHVGRTLAMLDWNRDGRVDLVANHLDHPIALLQNNSMAGAWLQLELIGTTSERDAIGAEVSVEIGDEQWTGWQTGGDGYMCTNEPLVHFGLANSDKIDRVEIRWPGGAVQTFENVAPNHRYLVIENHSDLFRRQ